jgi:hypothetical protein
MAQVRIGASMRDATGQAKNAFNTASATAGEAGANASGVNAALTPQLEREFQNPTGYSPDELNKMNVASEQGAGGAESSLKGEAAGQVARTRNSAGYSTALDEAARDKTRSLSENSLNIQGQNAKLAQANKQHAGDELAGIYGTDVKETLGAQGLMPEDINAETNSGNSGWYQNMTNLMNTLANVRRAFGKSSSGDGGGGGN